MKDIELQKLIKKLLKLPRECEWIEFKQNFHNAEEIGKNISALANGASLHEQPNGYLIFGIKDTTHKIVGTDFKPKSKKVKNEELEHWLLQRLNPRIDYRIKELTIDNKLVTIFIIPAAHNRPVEFYNIPYIRVGSISRKLNDIPEKARKIWKKDDIQKFEDISAKKELSESDIIEYLDTHSYYNLLNIPYPSNRDSVVEKFINEGFIRFDTDNFEITNLGGLLFAKDLSNFELLKRKAIRVIVYKGKNRVNTIREQIGNKGYASGFKGLLDWVNGQLPANEVIERSLRKNVPMYPEISIRELIANSIIHQDFNEKGFPMIEIFSDRVEISNPGLPLISPDRFIDEYQSRNEKLADMMRRLGICEEKGSGVDKVISATEVFQLPAPNFIHQEKHTKSILYSYKDFNTMDKKDKIRACYQHCCLKYVTNEKMTNKSLRERFKISSHNAAIVSRIIRATLKEELIKDDDPSTNSRKYAKYIPYWA